METPGESTTIASDAVKQRPVASRGPAACKQCRARKVRCNRNHPRCLGCTRLELHCSFEPSASPEPAIIDATELTQAGTKRKRSRLACKACRTAKAKCSGRDPCERCVAKGLPCEDSTMVTGSDVALLQEESHFEGPAHETPDAMSIGNSATPRRDASTGTESFLDKATVRTYLDAYFDTASRSTVAVLHKPTVLADWSRGKLDPALLQIIVATGRYTSEGHDSIRTWVRETQHHVVSNWARYTLTQLQIIVLLMRLRFQTGDSVEVWNLLPLAARLAFTMRFNYEQEDLEPVTQESRRRLVWAIYHLDRQFSGGIEDLAVCPPEKIHVRLPCDEQTFQRGVHSRANFLTDTEVQDGIGMDVYSFQLRLFVIRERVLRYTKRVRRQGIIPLSTYNELQTLQSDLDRFEQTLPADLRLTDERTVLMAHSTESIKYLGLHVHWMQCHCDLYRYCVPGLRESISKDVLARTPAEFVDFCQRACLNMALRLCDLWAAFYHMEPSEATNDTFLPISIYSVAQICRQLQHLLSVDGEHSLQSVKEKLLDALKLAAPLEIMPGPRKCMRDAEKVILSMGEHSVGSSSRASSVGGDELGRDHLPSKHTLFPRFSKAQQAEATGDEVDEFHIGGMLPKIPVSEPGDDAARAMLDLANAGQCVPGVSVEDMVPWDPFDMETDDYYNPELGDLLASMGE